MALLPPTLEVVAFWDLSGPGSDVWTVGDPVRGALDEYGITGDLETDITEFVRPGITITRGRNRITDEIPPGDCQLIVKNDLRYFDPFNTASPFYPNLIPGKKFIVRLDGHARFTGKAVDYDPQSGRERLSTVVIKLKDSLASLGRAELDAFTPVGVSASEQINEALDRPEVAFGANRDISGGVSTLGSYPVEQGANALRFTQTAARSDLGRFFADTDDIATFLDRHATIPDGDASVAEFADDGTGIPFSEISLAQGDDVLFTRTVVSRVGGSTEITDAPDAALIYGQISTAGVYTDLFLADDEQSASMSDFLAAVFSDPETRVASIKIRLQSCQTAADRAAVLDLDIGSLVKVTRTPDGVGDPIVQYCVVEGFREDIVRVTPVTCDVVIEVFLGAVLQFGVWTIEDELFGALDESPIAF